MGISYFHSYTHRSKTLPFVQNRSHFACWVGDYPTASSVRRLMLWGKKEWQQASTIGFAGWEEETGIESFTELPAPDHEGLCEESESPSIQSRGVWYEKLETPFECTPLTRSLRGTMKVCGDRGVYQWCIQTPNLRWATPSGHCKWRLVKEVLSIRRIPRFRNLSSVVVFFESFFFV